MGDPSRRCYGFRDPDGQHPDGRRDQLSSCPRRPRLDLCQAERWGRRLLGSDDGEAAVHEDVVGPVDADHVTLYEPSLSSTTRVDGASRVGGPPRRPWPYSLLFGHDRARPGP